MEKVVNSLIEPWFIEHPFIAWLLQHPVIAIIGIILLFVLFTRLIFALATLIDRLWLWLLQSPFMFIKSLVGWKTKKPEKALLSPRDSSLITPEQFNNIMEQLSNIEQQQKEILKEINLIKKNNKEAITNEQYKVTD